MAELKVGLAPNRTSYFDKVTNTYITLQKPVQKITYNEADMPGTIVRLEKIVHALFASVPALVLYEGNVPQECIEAWQQKYMKPFNTDMTKRVRDLNGNMVAPAVQANRAFDRPSRVNAKSADVVTASTEQAELVDESELKATSGETAQEVLFEETPQEVKPKRGSKKEK